MFSFSRAFVVGLVSFNMIASVLDAQQASPQSPKQPEHSPDVATLIAFMQPTTPVLSVGDMTMTWAELAPTVKYLSSRTKGDAKRLKSELFQVLRSCSQRGLFLLEARATKLTVSPEERLQLENDMLNNLSDSPKKVKREDLPKFFSAKQSSLTRLTYEDMLKLLQFEKIHITNAEVTPDMLKKAMTYNNAINNALIQQNKDRKANCEKLAKDKRSQTDKGFAELCKEYSEGVEAEWGGELKYDFTREELAAVCYMDKFDFKVGQTTPVCETNSAFRIVRVLREVPQKDGKPAKLRVAQILVGKIQTQDTSKEAITAKLKMELAKQKMLVLSYELARKYPVKSLFFPQGLWMTAPQASKESTLPKAAQSGSGKSGKKGSNP